MIDVAASLNRVPRWLLYASAVLVVVVLAVGAGIGIGAAMDSSGDKVSTASASGAYNPPGAQPVTPPVTSDAQVCGDLARLGQSFYVNTFAPMMINGGGGHTSMNVDPMQLGVQLGVLTTIGAPPNQIDGSAAIAQASPEVSAALITVTRDADRIAQSAVNSSKTGMNLVPDITPVVTSFSTAIVACGKAGYMPSYVDLHALTGH